MPLDEQTRAFLDKVNSSDAPPPGSVPLEEFREAVEAFRPLQFELEEIAEVRDVTVPGLEGRDVSARLYRAGAAEPVPIVVWAHGGSWVRVTIDLLDGYFRFVARHSRCAILAVDYELSPESTFPTAIEEVYAATVWARDHGGEFGGDPERLAIAGESSGGNLAAAATLLSRDRGGPRLAHQLLMLPVLDGLFESTSWQELGTDYMLTRKQLEWALEQYAPGVDRTRALLSPLRAESFADLPPTTVAVGEFDPLRDEGLAYAERLREAGVPVSVIDMPGLIHHALLVPKAIDLGRQFVLEVAEHLGAALGTPGKSSARTT